LCRSRKHFGIPFAVILVIIFSCISFLSPWVVDGAIQGFSFITTCFLGFI
jgi:hypothetical protein